MKFSAVGVTLRNADGFYNFKTTTKRCRHKNVSVLKYISIIHVALNHLIQKDTL